MNSRLPSRQLSLADVIEQAAALVAGGQVARAIALYEGWIREDGTALRKVALFNLGVLQSGEQRLDAARASYEQALRIDPQFHQARLNLGSLLERMGHLDEAVATWQVSADSAVDPRWEENWSVRALNQIGRLLEQDKRLSQAQDALHRSLMLDPHQPDVQHHYLHLRQKQRQWPITQPVPGLGMNEMLMSMSPLSSLAYSDDPALLLLSARNFVARKLVPPPARAQAARRYRHERLRIGYLSGDLCTHAVGLLLAEVLAAHDRTAVETFAFEYSPQDGSAHRARLLGAFEHVHPVGALGDEQVAQLIQACEIDVLVDLHGLSSGLRAGVLALRPAPVQVTWLGFIGTTAMPWIDYVIGDHYTLPDALAPYFSEKFLRLDTCFLPADRQRYLEVPVRTRADEGLPEDAVVFGCFNNSYKINPSMADLWIRILERVPGSVLWLVDDNPEATRNFRNHVTRAGMDPGRVVFSPRAGTDHYLARLRLMDLFLDCFPYNAGSTARDALEMGTPMLTLSGRSFVSRMVGSALHHLGLHELITGDAQAYVETAVSLGNQPQRLQQLRQRVQEAVSSAPGAQAFTRSLERLLVQAHRGGDLQPYAGDLTLLPARSTAPVARAVRAIDARRVHPHVIGYSEATFSGIAPPWKPLDYRGNDRPDWQEYWPIRRFLMSEPLDEEAYYGFFSPRFTEKTGLDGAAVLRYVAQLPDDLDVILFSPQPDMGAFFLNVFEQNELFDPGFTAAAQRFCESAGLEVELGGLIMDSRQIVFSNYFLARPAFWRRWLALGEKLFNLCEQQPDLAAAMGLLAPTSYRDGITRKVFLMERLASLLLALEPAWRVHAYNTFRCAYSASRLNEFPGDAVVSDALKIAASTQKYPEFIHQFSKIRDKLRN